MEVEDEIVGNGMGVGSDENSEKSWDQSFM